MFLGHNRIALECNTIIQSKKSKYKIEGTVGYGGSSIVYKATAMNNNTPVIVKELYPKFNNCIIRKGNSIVIRKDFPEYYYEQAVKYFNAHREKAFKESKVYFNMIRDYNEYVEKPEDFFEANNTLYTVFRGNNGYVLSDNKHKEQLKKQLLGEKQSFLLYIYFIYIKRILAVLQSMHRRGYLHLDIAPDNIYRTELSGGEDVPILRLIDFNNTVHISELGGNKMHNFSYKEGFSAPELCRGEFSKLCFASDLYSVGAVLFYFISDRTPTALDRVGVKYIIGKNTPIRRGVSDKTVKRINEFIYKAIDVDPKARFQSCEEMLSEVNEIIKALAPKMHTLRTQMPSPIEPFCGRKKELKQISDYYNSGQRCVFLTGDGGMGKTELAIKYAAENPELESHFEVYKGNMRNTILSMEFTGYSTRDEYDKPKSEETIYKEKLDLLHQYDDSCLLIIDNFDCKNQSPDEMLNEQAFKDIMGTKIRLLFTTRNKVELNPVPVDKLPMEDLIGIIRHYYKSEDSTATDEVLTGIIDAVESHIMTVELIAKTMQESRGRITAIEMRDIMKEVNLEYEKFKEVVSQKDRQTEGYSNRGKLYAHLKKLFDLSNLSKNEKDVLANLVLLSDSGMYYTLFVDLKGCEDEKVLDGLIRKGWVRCNDTTNIITLHTLVSEVCFRELKPSYAGKCKVFISGLVNNSIYNHISKLQIINTVERAVERLGNIEENDKAYLYSYIGSEFYSLCSFDKALKYGLNALEIFKKVLPTDHPDLASSYNNVGCTYDELGKHEDALEHQLKALEIRKKVLPTDHPDLASSYNNVGCTYDELGKHEDALEHQLKALEIRKKVLPTDHPDLAISYNYVGYIYNELGKYEDALEHQLKALEIWEKVLPSDHPDLATLYANIGYTYGKLGEHKKELKYRLKALETFKDILSPDSPFFALKYKDVAHTYMSLHEYKKALNYYLSALSINETSLAKNNDYNIKLIMIKEIKNLCNIIADLYEKLNQPKKAKEYRKKADAQTENPE